MVETVDSITKIIDVNEEDDSLLSEKLTQISKKHNAVLMACIAPYVGLKVSPTKTVNAQMGLSEEFAVETAINQIQTRTDAQKLLFLVNSPGGLVQSSYKIARALRQAFKEIIVFVPHIAASGGTLLALTGNKIVMGMMSQLSPLDPQAQSGEGVVSANSVVDAHQFVTTLFDERAIEDAPYSYKALADKFDSVDIRDALASLSLMEGYICEILEGSGYNKTECKKISKKIVRGFKTHDEVITIEKAKKIGLKVVSHSEFPEEWNMFREWLAMYMLQSADKHIIRFVISEERDTKRTVRR
ncbi:MAG: ATP-dependent Clp protease proteolytic subunit [Candidatus Bathyarchaeota archaeon]|nr:ATP-dependent Clp protease proteolytic subunit [Candidatus Bathyarchaeum sp.]